MQQTFAFRCWQSLGKAWKETTPNPVDDWSRGDMIKVRLIILRGTNPKWVYEAFEEYNCQLRRSQMALLYSQQLEGLYNPCYCHPNKSRNLRLKIEMSALTGLHKTFMKFAIWRTLAKKQTLYAIQSQPLLDIFVWRVCQCSPLTDIDIIYVYQQSSNVPNG